MTTQELQEKLEQCTFVIYTPDKCAVAIKDIPEGFLIVAKGLDDEAEKIKAAAESLCKLVVETEPEPQKFYDEFQVDVPFTKWAGFLIDIMEEFRLIKTGSKKV